MADKRKKSGGATTRKADKLAGKGSYADALKRSRKAKERGNLMKAREIMQDFKKRSRGK